MVDFARRLAARGLEILSTGGTARALGEAGVPVREVSDFTGAPEILDGRVKTLHPRVHGGILGRPTPEHRGDAERPRPDRSGRGEPLSVPRDGGARRAVRRDHREHRHRRPGDDPLGGQEPRAGGGDRRSGRLRAGARARSTPRARSRRRPASRLAAQGLRPHGRLRRRDRLAPRADVDAGGAAGRFPARRW